MTLAADERTRADADAETEHSGDDAVVEYEAKKFARIGHAIRSVTGELGDLM